jgi:hyperosmotically inducible protein
MKRLRIAIAMNLLLFGGGAAVAAAQAFALQAKPKLQEKPSDTLVRSVHHQIQVLPFYSVFDNIEFRVEGNKVTLTGQVLRTTLKTHAESTVRTLEGVAVVVNQIEVLPASASDDELRRAIYRVLFEDDVLKRYAVETVPPIHIIVKDGNVILEGAVQSDSDRKLASALSGEVPNSKSLQNHLMVKAR